MKKLFVLLIISTTFSHHMHASLAQKTKTTAAAAATTAATNKATTAQAVQPQVTACAHIQGEIEFVLTSPAHKEAQAFFKNLIATLVVHQKTIVDFLHFKANKTPANTGDLKKMIKDLTKALGMRPIFPNPKVEAQFDAMQDKKIEEFLADADAVPLSSISQLSLQVIPANDGLSATISLKTDAIAPATATQIIALFGEFMRGLLGAEFDPAQSTEPKVIVIKKYSLNVTDQTKKA